MIKKIFVAGVCIAFVVAACKKDDDQVLGQDHLIHIEFETDTSALFADNNTVMQFRAVIPPETKEAFRSVTFSATEGIGEFQGTIQDKKKCCTGRPGRYCQNGHQVGYQTRQLLFISANHQ